MTTPSNNNPTTAGANPGGPSASAAPGSGPLNSAFIGASSIAPSGPAIDNTQPNINALNQPQILSTFVYSPAVRVVIAHTSTGIEYDVSKDLIRGSLVRQENSAASFFMTLQNSGLRYTPQGAPPLFSRMDRIVVFMKKTSWIQVFSGYLDQVPYKQLYPGPVQFKATCTIKRLMHTWWDPALANNINLVNQYTASASSIGGAMVDTGLGVMLTNILVQVGGWNPADIHIQNFPLEFYTFMATQLATLTGQGSVSLQALQTMLLGSNTSPGPGASAGYNTNAGAPGSYAPSAATAGGLTGTPFYVSQIVAACDDAGMGPTTSDNDLGAALVQAGATGATSASPTSNPSNQQAWDQVQQTGQDIQSANRNSDGAILGVATAITETGVGAPIIRNLANLAVIGSNAFPNDGYTTNGTSCGIMAQQSSVGDVSQRMNPKQAAAMFFSALATNVSGWRSLDAGSACQQVQLASSPVPYDANIETATSMVQAYRATLAGPASAVTSVGIPGTNVATTSLGQAAAGLGGAPSQSVASVLGGAATVPAPLAAVGTVSPTNSASPQPNSEGAINFMMTNCIGLPYVWGGTGPAGYDCSGLQYMAFKSIGIDIGRTTDAIAGTVASIPQTSVQRGDLVEPNSGHVVMWLGDGTVLEAQQQGVPIGIYPNSYGAPGSWYGAYRACLNGGVNPTAPFNPPASMGPGTPPSALQSVGGAGATGSSGAQEGIARNLFSFQFNPGQFVSQTASLFTGYKAFIEGQPLIQMVSGIAAAGLRNWYSGPDGSLIFFYPDYWGLDGKPAVMSLADIELKDCTINFSDDPLSTHVYINGSTTMGISDTADTELAGWLSTSGVVTVEQPWLFQMLMAAAPGDLDVGMSGEMIMQQFGVRPYRATYACAGQGSELEFLIACQVFMMKWAEQYKTTISMTFMPELFPGMRVSLQGHNLQVYVSGVQHNFDFEQGFTTDVTIMAPSNPVSKQLMSSVNTAVDPNDPAFSAFTNLFGTQSNPTANANTTTGAGTAGTSN
jgi:cell wall-associated NlpC family hydrolase